MKIRAIMQCFSNKSVIATDAGSVIAEAVGGSRRTIFRRRCRDVVSSVVPAVILASLPKCPVCVAAYVAMGSGIGLSLPVAAHLRTLLVILCATSLTYFIARQIRRRLRPRVSA